MKAIETTYQGRRYRSRTEAKWAVFFNELMLPFEYEKEGFVIGGVPYLPDFWLPTIGVWLEIKGERAEPEKVALVRGLANETGKAAVIWQGLPDLNLTQGGSRYGKIWCGGVGEDDGGEIEEVCQWVNWENGGVGLCLEWDSNMVIHSRDCMKLLPLVRPHSQGDYSFALVTAASVVACDARFEHGEKPRGDK